MTDGESFIWKSRITGSLFRGLFWCEGRYDQTSCRFNSRHTINPYQSYEARILFSTWNLDHLVERSRTVVPGLVRAVKGRKRNQTVNTEYFYSLLFGRDNLKVMDWRRP